VSSKLEKNVIKRRKTGICEVNNIYGSMGMDD